MSGIRKREEQRREDTWNLEAIFASDAAWEEEAKKLEPRMEAFEGLQGKLSESSERMLEIVEEYCGMSEILWKLDCYASMRLDQDTANSHYQQMEGKAQVLYTRYQGVTSWVKPEILEMEDALLNRFLEENEQLKMYQIYLKEITRRKEHMLSKDKERMMAALSELRRAPGKIYSMFNNADVSFESVEGEDGEVLPLTQGTFVSLEQNPSRRIRRDAFEKLYRGYAKFGNTVAAMFDANVRQAVFGAKERHYDSSLAAALDDSQIPVAVYHRLIDTVHANLPSMHRYVSLRKRMLEVDELHMYDVYMSMVKDVNKKYSFEEAKEMVLEGLAPLGEEYLSILREGFENRWIDVYENEGKRTGAYSSGCYGTNPYVLLNFQGTLDHVFTLAHEMGHSVHSYYTRKNQPFIYGDYEIFVAEVASTCNEALLIRHLLQKTTDTKERAYLINHFLEQFKSTLYRQTMFAEFEKIVHERVEAGDTLNAKTLCGIYHDLNRQYFGEDMISDEEIAWEWARIPHFYTPFYVYQYATGFSAAIAIAKKIWNGEEHAVENYKKFLSGGSSMSPIELLKLCGVDMESPKPVQDALNMFAEYLDAMEETI